MLVSVVANGSLLTPEHCDTTLPWWSFTKTVLAAAALTLVRDGLVVLDHSVAEGPFSLRQLLRHEAGLADYCELTDYHTAVASHENPWPVDDMLRRLDASRLRYAPGDGWRYSNVGYLFVARLIKPLPGLSLEEALNQRIFTPLGLSRVRLAKTRADLETPTSATSSVMTPAGSITDCLSARWHRPPCAWTVCWLAIFCHLPCYSRCKPPEHWAARLPAAHGRHLVMASA